MKAIILIAGMGTRLKPLTNEVPKCLTEVNGKPILINMLENLESCGINEVVLVIGYFGDKIKQRIGERFGDMKISYTENIIYNKTNTSYSLWLALKDLEIEDHLLVLEGDVFFEKKLLEKFLEYGSLTSTVLQKYNENLDGSFVEVSQGKVTDWVHKSKRSEDFIIKDKFKTVNIHRFDKNFINDYLKPTLKEHIEKANGTEPIEYIMQDIVKEKKAEIYSFDADDLKWFEIDDLNDLKIAENIFKLIPSLEEIESFHGGYWKYDILDFHYLVNLHFPTEKMYEEIKQKLPELIECYPSTQRIITKLLSKWKDKPYFNEDNLIITNGSSEAIRILNQIIDKITVPIPTYNEYVMLPKEKLNCYSLLEENKFKINIDKLIEEIRVSKSNFTVIVNPNNPVGNITPREDIIKLLETGVNVIVDEAFIDFSIEDSVEDLVEKYENLIVIKTVTKTMGLAGLRLGYVLTTNKEIKEKIKQLLPVWNVNSIAEHFIEIFPEYEKDYWKSIEKTKKDRQELFNELKTISFLEPYETKSNFIFCKTKINSKKLGENLYNKYKIVLRTTLNQKTLKSEEYVRIAIRTKQENNKLINALKEIEEESLYNPTTEIKKVMLINPPNSISKDSIRRLATPLGLLYIGSALKEKGYDVKILDSTCEGYYNTKINGDYLTYGLSDEEIIREIKKYNPDIVGISSMFSAHQKNALHHCDLVKSIDKNILVVLGGIDPSLRCKESLQHNSVDFVILGEGEYRFPKLLDSLNHNQEPDFDGIGYKKNNEIIINPTTTRINDLDSLPLPARDLINMEDYIKIGVPFAPFSRKERTAQIMTSRGCPFNCVFCSSIKLWGRKFRMRSAESVIQEVDELVNKYNIKEIQFSDDNLTINRKRAIEIFNKLEPYNLSWCTPNGVMIKTLDKEMIEAMAKSGAYQLSFAIESGSQRVLKEIINKSVPEKSEVKKLIQICHDNGISVHGMLVVGFPGETREEIQETLDYPFQVGLDSASYFIANPLPGSRLYQQCKEKGYLKKDMVVDFKSAEIIIPEDSPDYTISREELEKLVDEKTREFNEFSKKRNPHSWDDKFKSFLKKHGDKADLILGRVT